MPLLVTSCEEPLPMTVARTEQAGGPVPFGGLALFEPPPALHAWPAGRAQALAQALAGESVLRPPGSGTPLPGF